MQSPNFERFFDLIGFTPEDFEIKAEGYWAFKNEVLIEWALIENGKISYPEYPELEALLKENNLNELLPDFRFMGYMFSDWVKKDNENSDARSIAKLNKLEELQALSFLHQKKGKLKIEIKRTDINEKTLIQNQKIIKVIEQSLFENFKKTDFWYKFKIQSCDFRNKDIHDLDWGSYFESRIKEQKADLSRRGRKKNNLQLSQVYYYLWSYLQKYTEIKAESGKVYSHPQARFMNTFLKIFGLIKNQDEYSRKEDITGYYLRTYIAENKE